MTRELDKARALKERLRAGEVTFGAQIALTDSTVIEILGRAGFDWLLVDTEHSAQTPQTVKAMLQAGMQTDAVVLARPTRLDPDLIRLYLDLGSPGVVCPFIETGEQARLLVAACHYPPAGLRGYGPRRAHAYGFDALEYFEMANESMLCIPIIESKEAVKNISQIVAVDGIDAVSIGPMDLSISLGVFRQFEHPDYVHAVQAVRDACTRYGKAMGTGCYSLEHALDCRNEGDPFLLVMGDDLLLQQGAVATISALR